MTYWQCLRWDWTLIKNPNKSFKLRYVRDKSLLYSFLVSFGWVSSIIICKNTRPSMYPMCERLYTNQWEMTNISLKSVPNGRQKSIQVCENDICYRNWLVQHESLFFYVGFQVKLKNILMNPGFLIVLYRNWH